MERIKKYWPYVLILVLLLFAVYQCNDSDRLRGQTDELKKNVEKQTAAARAEKAKNEPLKEKIAALAASDTTRKQAIAALEAENNRLRQRVPVAKAEAAKDYPKFFSSRYNLPVSISPEPAISMIASDLIEGDGAKSDLEFANKILAVERTRIAAKDSIIGINGQVITNLEAAAEQYENALSTSSELVEKQNKIINRKSNQSLILKIAIPAAFAAGFIIAK